MIDLNSFIMFSTASLLLGLAPGPDNIFVLTQSVLYGRKAGFMVTLGLCTGLVVHTLVVTFGVSAIFQTSIIAFSILKYIGVIYLLYLSYMAFKATGETVSNKQGSALPSSHLYRRGIIMNVTNPKVSIFFMAFLPQFTNVENGSITLQLILLGFIFMVSTLLVFGTISQVSGTLGQYLFKSPRFNKILNRVAGTIFAAIALKLAFTER
ncbi:MAG: LysE family translocator [Ignavibacteria bacterium]|jgi:threonine/homoserine/homoserine lactone efflux protein